MKPLSLVSGRGWVLLRWLFPVGLFFALAAYTLISSRAQYERRAEQLSQTLAEALEQGIAARIDRIDMSLQAIARHMEYRQGHPTALAGEVEDHVDFYAKNRGEMGVVTVTDASGNVLAGRPDGGARSREGTANDAFAAQRDSPDIGLFISPPRRASADRGWSIVLSRRFNSRDGGFAGTVSAEVPLSYFQRQIEAVNVASDGFVTLRNAQLQLLARWTRADLRADTVGSTRVSPAFRSIVESGTAQATYRSRSPLDDLERTNTLRRVADLPLVVIIGLSPRDYLSDWHRQVQAVVALSILVSVLYLGGAFFVWRVQQQNRASQQRIELMAKVFEYSGEAIVVAGPDHRILQVNPAFLRATGYSAEEVIGRPETVVNADRMSPVELDGMRQSVAETGFWRGECWHRAKNGTDLPKWLSISTLRDRKGQITHYISSSTDVTELKAAEERVLHLAHHDTLTQLPNRVLLHRQLEQSIAEAREKASQLSMLFIDMDRFKNINDTLGHPVGDGLLMEVGQRLRRLVRERDIVARLGGDEFVVVLTDLGDGARASATVAAKILAELGLPYIVRGHELHSTPSIGIGLYPADGQDADTLLKNADTAMYHAKAVGRNNYQYFTAAMNEATLERLTLEAGLRGIVERNELFIEYQPQIDLATMKVLGLEALLRWRHPEMGLVPPLKFIPIAEDTGQIEEIGQWVLDEALRQLAVWRARGHAELRVAVNLSAQQLRGEAIVEQVSRALARHSLPGQALELEITESIAMQDPSLTAKLLAELRRHGVAVAIDDFGTGYSSLAYLKQLPLSCLKLDRSFVADLEHDANDAAICTATIQLAHSLGLGVVAEGVETSAQLQFLRRLDCDMAQGYFIGRPMGADACGHYLGRLPVAETGDLQPA